MMMQGGKRSWGRGAHPPCRAFLLLLTACLLHLPMSLQGRQGSVSAGSAVRVLAESSGRVDSNQCRISKRLVMALRGGAGRRKRLDWQSPKKYSNYASESSDEWNPDSDDGGGRSHRFGKGNRRHSGYSEPSGDNSADEQMDDDDDDDDDDESASAPPPPRPRHRQHQSSISQGSGMRRKPRKAALDARARWGTRAHDALELAMRGMMPDSSEEGDSDNIARHQVVLQEKPKMARQQQPRVRASAAWGGTAEGGKQRGKVVVAAPPPASTSSSSSPAHWKAQADKGNADPWEFGGGGILADDDDGEFGDSMVVSPAKPTETQHVSSAASATDLVGMRSGPQEWLKAAMEMPSSRTSPRPAPPSLMHSLMQSALPTSSPPRLPVTPSPVTPLSPATQAAASNELQPLHVVEHEGGENAEEESEEWRDEGGVAEALEDATKAACDAGGGLLLGKGVRKVMPGDGGGGQWSSSVGVRTDGISGVMSEAVAAARAASRLVHGEGRDEAGGRLDELEGRAEALRSLLEGGASARSELLAVGKPTKVRGSAIEWDASRLEALAAKRSMILNNTWAQVSQSAGAAGSSPSPQQGVDTVYFGRLGGRPEGEVRGMLESRCGRVDDFEWCRSWCFAKFGASAGAARAMVGGDSFGGMVVVPAPGGRVIRGGILIEMGMRGKVNV